jgi:hypothetical protein
MAREDFRTLDAIAWLDPSVARVSTRKSEPHPTVTHDLQGQPRTVSTAEQRGSPRGSADDNNNDEVEEGYEEGDSGNRGCLTSWRNSIGERIDMRACIESKTAPSASRDRRRCGRVRTIFLGIQLSLILSLGVAVFGALLLDSRQYYGIDVDGQPLYQEHRLSYGNTLDIDGNG